MKRDLKCSLVLIPFFLMCSVASAEIVGSAHDFSTKSWSSGKICEPCHTPHNANVSVSDDGPLWNRETNLTTYTFYTSPTMDYPAGTPGGVSKACLSCHDGTVAMDSFGGMSGTTFLSGPTAVGSGGDLSNDHPIGVEWRHQTTSTCVNHCHFVDRKVEFFGARRTVECASCHDPHNGTMNPKMLRAPLFGSEICFQCHTDKE